MWKKMIRGEVAYLYAFDVASEIIPQKIKDILAGQPMPFELRVNHTLPKDIPLYKPLSMESEPLLAEPYDAQVRPIIHIYDIGVISIVMRIAFAVEHMQDLQPFHDLRLKGGRTLDKAVFDLCLRTCENLKNAMVHSATIPEPEAYTVFCFTDLGNAQDIEEWMENNRDQIAGLLTQNAPGTLSSMQIGEIFRIHRSYARTDLAVIDWDAALVVDLTGYVEDVLYVLELANLQLEEYRIIDQRLDRYLNKAYDDIQQRTFPLFGTYSRILRNLRTLRVDVTKLTDEVTHITKFFGDWYLAQVYMGARERFHLNQWRNSVEERLKQIDSLYSVAHTEITNQRMLWLEALIVFLFAADLFSIFFLKR